MFSVVSSAATRRWKQRTEFRSMIDWVTALSDAGVRHYGRRFASRHGGIRRIFLRTHPYPLFFRLGSADGAVIEEIFIRRIYEPVCASITQANLIVDLGANAGYSVAFWGARFPTSEIIAVEPDRNNCQIMK